MRLKDDDAAKVLHLVTSEVNDIAREFGWSPSQVRALQQYIVLVCVIVVRRRRQIPHEKEFKRAKVLQRCLTPDIRRTLCDDLLFAV